MDDPNSAQIGLDIDQDCRISAADRDLFGLAQGRIQPALAGTCRGARRSQRDKSEAKAWSWTMGRGLLLWLIGIPLPIILVIWLFGGLS